MRSAWTALALVLTAALVVPPLAGWPAVVRLPAILVPGLGLALLIARPWRPGRLDAFDEWALSKTALWSAAAIVAALLFWLVLTRFRSGAIDAVDFTVYFDRPSFQTLHGRPLFVETADLQTFSYRSELAVHAYWAMLPLAIFYAIAPSPLWLLALSVAAVVAGMCYVRQIARRQGANDLCACATALAFALNANTARALNYGFHPEILYAWFVPWILDAGLRKDRRSFLLGTCCCVLVKEDACLALFAASVALALWNWRALTRGERLIFLVAPTALALLNLGAFYLWVVPALNNGGAPTYSAFWANYGPTPLAALIGMARHPKAVLAAAMTSGFFRTALVPHLFLPLVAWRWSIGLAPTVALYGASTNEQLRAYGVYYAMLLVPFLVLGSCSGALTIARALWRDPRRAQLAAASAVLLGAVLVGSTDAGYSLRPWRPEITAMPAALKAISAPTVLVQSALYAHAGYDARVKMLTPTTLHDAADAGAVVLMAAGMDAYPFTSNDLDGLRKLPRAYDLSGGLIAVRRPDK